METIEELRASRSRVLELLSKARTKLFEQDEVIQELRDENDAQRKTIGSLRADIVWLKTRQAERDKDMEQAEADRRWPEW